MKDQNYAGIPFRKVLPRYYPVAQISDNQSGDTESVRFEFGDKILRMDSVTGISQAEIRLEVETDDIEKAADYLVLHHCVRRDEIEDLPTTI